MSEDPFRPLKMNNKTVSWFTVSGRAKSLRGYTQTHTIPGSGIVPKTQYTQEVTEFWIKDRTGTETPLVLPWDLLLAEGQRVSAVHSGIEGSSKSAWLVLVNHDAQTSHYLESPRGFLHKAGVIILVSRWILFVLLGLGLLAYLYFWGRSPVVQGAPYTALWTVSLWPWLALCLAPALAVAAFDVWQSWRTRQAWKEVQAIVPGMVNSLLGMTDDIDWAEPITGHLSTEARERAEPAAPADGGRDAGSS
jgi:hypothetical protein